MTRLVTCRRCRQERRCKARELCGWCYDWARHHGLLDTVAAPAKPVGRPVARPHLLEDAAWLVEHGGYSWQRPEHLAERFGMTKTAFLRAVYRYRARERADAERSAS